MMTTKHKNLTNSKININDEYYTQLIDIEKELVHYTDHFKGKKIYLNCDNPEQSKFWTYFETNFETFHLKQLTATYYTQTGNTIKTVKTADSLTKTELKVNGDFRTKEMVNILKEHDLLVTNPPFSLFRDLISILLQLNKQYLILGNKNALTYKEIFPLLRDGKMFLGFVTVALK